MTFTPRRLAFSLPLAILLHLAPAGPAAGSPSSDSAALDVFVEALSQIREKYVEPIDEDELIEAAIEGMVRSLDRHSRYFEPDRLDAVRARLRGQYGGVGIQVTKENGLITVIEPWEGMPAFQAGIRPGDVITHLNGDPLRGLRLSEAIRRMRGPTGTQVAMTIHRDGIDDSFEVNLTRETINVRSVRYRAEGRIGYIRITRFDRRTQPGLEEAIEAIETELRDRLLGYILDLRGNPGGLVSQAVSVSDSFLDEGRILTTRGRHPSKNRQYDATAGDLADGLPMVVLINSRSASASEIVAGALQDHHRAILLGSQSYGKGTVQSTISLDNDGAIRITTARYYTPSGRSIHGVGIAPDIVVEQPKAEASADGEEDGTAPDVKPADVQLARAVDLLCGIAAFHALDDPLDGHRTRHAPPPATMVGARPEAATADRSPSPTEGEDSGGACAPRKPFIAAVLPADV